MLGKTGGGGGILLTSTRCDKILASRFVDSPGWLIVLILVCFLTRSKGLCVKGVSGGHEKRRSAMCSSFHKADAAT